MENLGLLPFGNVSVAVITLVVAALAIALLLELGIWVVRLLIAADDENAPDIVIKNFVKDVINKIWGLLVVEPEEEDLSRFEKHLEEVNGKWRVSHGVGSFKEFVICGGISRITYSFEVNIRECCEHETKLEALKTAAVFYRGKSIVQLASNKENLYKLLGSILAVDVTLLLLKVNFTLTVVALGIFGVGFSTRFIAKKLYKTMRRTTKNEDDIKDLQETVKVKGVE